MKNNYHLLIVFIWVNQIFSISTEELDYIDNVDDVDGCANPNEHLDESDGCHHSKFPEDTLQQLYGPNVKQCCSSHGYTYKQNELCEVRLYIFSKYISFMFHLVMNVKSTFYFGQNMYIYNIFVICRDFENCSASSK